VEISNELNINKLVKVQTVTQFSKSWKHTKYRYSRI